METQVIIHRYQIGLFGVVAVIVACIALQDIAKAAVAIAKK